MRDTVYFTLPPLGYFYGESANAIKIQIWVTLIANLLLSVLQSTLNRRWSFSGLATMVRIVLMYYLNLEKFLNQPDADLEIMLSDASEPPPEAPENYWGACLTQKVSPTSAFQEVGVTLLWFSGQ